MWGVVWDRMFELFQVLFQGQDSVNYLKSGSSQLMSLWEEDAFERYCWEFGAQNTQ